MVVTRPRCGGNTMEHQWLTWAMTLTTTSATTEVGFFARDALPALSKVRVLAKDICDAFEYASNGGLLVFCD